MQLDEKENGTRGRGSYLSYICGLALGVLSDRPSSIFLERHKNTLKHLELEGLYSFEGEGDIQEQHQLEGLMRFCNFEVDSPSVCPVST